MKLGMAKYLRNLEKVYWILHFQFAESAAWKPEHENYDEFKAIWNNLLDTADAETMLHTYWE